MSFYLVKAQNGFEPYILITSRVHYHYAIIDLAVRAFFYLLILSAIQEAIGLSGLTSQL